MLSAIEIYSERVISHGFKARWTIDDLREYFTILYIKTLQSQFGSNKSRCI